MTDLDISISFALFTAAKRMNIKQTDISDRFRMSESAVSRMLNFKQHVYYSFVHLFCREFNFPIEDFYKIVEFCLKEEIPKKLKTQKIKQQKLSQELDSLVEKLPNL